MSAASTVCESTSHDASDNYVAHQEAKSVSHSTSGNYLRSSRWSSLPYYSYCVSSVSSLGLMTGPTDSLCIRDDSFISGPLRSGSSGGPCVSVATSSSTSWSRIQQAGACEGAMSARSSLRYSSSPWSSLSSSPCDMTVISGHSRGPAGHSSPTRGDSPSIQADCGQSSTA